MNARERSERKWTFTFNYHGKGNFNSLTDIVVLGTTQVDVNFNANVVIHSDGRLLHGIGGWQNCLFSGRTVPAVPSFRDRIPVIADRVTTLTGPSELIDVVITELGICINPRRKDLIEKTKSLGLPIIDIKELHEKMEKRCGGPPDPPRLGIKLLLLSNGLMGRFWIAYIRFCRLFADFSFLQNCIQ